MGCTMLLDLKVFPCQFYSYDLSAFHNCGVFILRNIRIVAGKRKEVPHRAANFGNQLVNSICKGISKVFFMSANVLYLKKRMEN